MALKESPKCRESESSHRRCAGSSVELSFSHYLGREQHRGAGKAVRGKDAPHLEVMTWAKGHSMLLLPNLPFEDSETSHFQQLVRF